MKFIKLLGIALLAVVLAACETTPEEDASLLDEQGNPVNAGAGVNNGAATSKYGQGDAFSGSGLNGGGGGGYNADGSLMGGDLNDPSSPLAKRVIYFQYDSSQVEAEFVPVINAHAQYLAANPSQHVVLEGHADERGSREYNIALGEQRAQAVQQMLQLQGVTPEQMEVVSYGEEKPANDGHDETAWHENRRVELRY